MVERTWVQEGAIEGMRDSGRDVRQGFDMVRGIRCAGVVPCSEQNPCVYGVGEVGSANTSELEGRPNGCQKGKEGVHRGLSRRRRTGRNATNRRAGFGISEKEFTKTPNCPSCWGQGSCAGANCGRETGCGHALRQNNEMRCGH